MSDLLIKVETLQNILISQATNGSESDEEYQKLRQEIITENSIQNYIPKFVRTCRNLSQFWQFIKFEYKSYAERRNFIWTSFQPVLDILEQSTSSPLDQIINQTIFEIDSSYIHTAWNKALERRTVDPEGAITIARTLLESTCKHILDEATVEYGDAPDLNHLYRLTAKQLNLSPSQHTQPVFKQILGGCTSVVEGLGALRNKISDAHGQGKLNVKPSPRHAELAVNLAGTMAVFLFSTWELRNESIIEP
ncbi:abortive phage resistance protein [Acinetobacter sp. ANC 4216]|uniref:abortive infection family protein n=1 Tax=unclassified Acinetobacter TaxID=196816 RepID=UPI001038DE7B|nr:abortive infection family protein [Acinetobacter sp. ANC 4216]TCB71336.1 abortive phage resistance protein [Acinetobacter sp. ANC 4216]